MRLAADYSEARARFLDLANAAGARVEHHDHPLRGPAGEALATDVAVLGRPDAPARLLVMSGTHGVEGFAGSACQQGWLASPPPLPDDLAVVFVHAINPYGFAWIRRVNEDNVDLNRNCIDFAADLPANEGYERLADVLVPERWDEETQRTSTAAMLAFAAEAGFDRLQAAVSSGQYRHPKGIFFGGTQPVWSQRTLGAIVAAALSGARRVGVLDLHTGLGPFGHGELIASRPDESGRARLEAWFGEHRVPSLGNSVSSDVTGDLLDAIDRWLPGAEVGAVAVEWGTVDIRAVSDALRADAWLHAHSDPRGPRAAAIKAQVRAAFAPNDPDWAAMVWDRFDELRCRALNSITR